MLNKMRPWLGGVHSINVRTERLLLCFPVLMSGGVTSCKQLVVALITFCKGWHNNHDAHPTSARHGVAWYEFDRVLDTDQSPEVLRSREGDSSSEGLERDTRAGSRVGW